MDSVAYCTLFLCLFLYIPDFITAEDTQNPLSDLVISANQASQLCRRLNESRIQNSQVYLWTKVHSGEDQNQQSKTLFTPGCYNIHYVQCNGKPRYPVHEECGYFTLQQQKDCTSKTRARRSTPAQSITLTHGQASHLCTSVQNLDLDDSAFSINYIPIKISLTPQLSPAHISEKCVSWVYKPCEFSEDSKCDDWNLQVGIDDQCTHYTDLFSKYNSSFVQSFPNPIFKKTDYLQDKDAENEAMAWNANFMSSVVNCTTEKKSVVCQIQPKTNEGRSKRAVKDSQGSVSRVKRYCCSLRYCGRCGFEGRGFWGRQVGVPGKSCDCSIDPWCVNHNVCDLHEYVGTCVGDCFT